MKAGSRLERVLLEGRFAITAEINPPDGADPETVYQRALPLATVVDGINATDASSANVHMSSLGVCAVLARAGYEPVLQISCRDRNRIAVQGDLLGAAALGIRNVLLLTGDGVQAGDQPQTKPVFDLDSVSALRTARVLRDKGQFLSGRKLDCPPRLFLGAAANPFAPPLEHRVQHLAKKVEAGADFIQTQYCFDVPRMREFMKRVCDAGLDRQVHILVGVGPLRSVKIAEWMRQNVPGVVIPDEVIARLKGVASDKQRLEGKQLCIDIVREVREIPGVHGIHIMAYRQEEQVQDIVEESGLLPRGAAGK